MFAQSYGTYVMRLTEIFSLIQSKNCLRSKIIELNELFLKFLPVQYLNQKTIFFKSNK